MEFYLRVCGVLRYHACIFNYLLKSFASHAFCSVMIIIIIIIIIIYFPLPRNIQEYKMLVNYVQWRKKWKGQNIVD